jgi:CMP-N,N'-diacetyllegionaminic acid synthase
MYKNNHFLSVIPARGGSKGIPGKNAVLINGLPLVSYTIREAKKSQHLDLVVLSTDDQKIAAIAQSEGIKVVTRSPELASDTAKTIDALLHTVAVLKTLGYVFDYLVLLQPTQPLRQADHIDGAIRQLIDRKQTSLASVSPVKTHPLFIRKSDSHCKLTHLQERRSTLRRQDLPSYYAVNGAIYINATPNLDENSSLNDNEYGYFMETKYDLDIDEPLDLVIMEAMLNYLERKSVNE